MLVIQPGPNIGLSAGTQAQGAGTVVFSNSNNVTFGMTNSSVVTASASFPADSVVNISAGTQLATSGTVIFSNSNGFTFGMSNSSIVTASYTQSTAPGAIQAGTQTATSGTIIFSNSNNVSFGMSNTSVVTASASYSQSTAPGAIQAGTQTATSGTVVFSNSNGFTFGMSDSSIITASYTQSTNLAALIAGTQTQTSGTVVFSNSNNVTFGMSNTSVVTASASYSQSTAPGGIAAGTQTGTSGTILFSNSNGVTFGMSNSSIITASVAGGGAAISAGTQSVSTGTVIFSNSNNVTFGMAGSATVTASVNPPTINLWQNCGELQNTALLGTAHGSLLLIPFNDKGSVFPGVMTANTILLNMSGSLNAVSTGAHTSTLLFGIYTISGSSTLNLLNSGSSTWSLSAHSDNSSNYNGPRFLSMHSSLFSASLTFSQTAYIAGIVLLSSSSAAGMSHYGIVFQNSAQRSGTIIGSVATATSMGWQPFDVGTYSASTTAFPSTIHISEVNHSGTGAGAPQGRTCPHIIFNNLLSAF